MTEDEIKSLMIQQAQVTSGEVATFCAELCDRNRGHLQVGDMIREQFGLGVRKEVKPEVKKPTKKVAPKGKK